MSFSRALLVVSCILFGTIAIAAWQKKAQESLRENLVETVAIPAETFSDTEQKKAESRQQEKTAFWPRTAENLPLTDRIDELFNIGKPQLPIVETLTYSSRVAWRKGRPAWVADYAAHYETSRHFIARSLNGRADYLSQNVNNGDLFTVFRQDRPLSFHLLVDASRAKMWFFYHDETTDERVLLKVYDVGLGRLDTAKASGLLTPFGSYQLGNKIAIYKPGVKGHYLGEKIEMVSVFGTRWIPFEKAMNYEATAPAKGYGLHGTPWYEQEDSTEWVDSSKGIGGYESDGCIRLRTEDIEELFAIIVTKPSYIHIVADFDEAQLPGQYVEIPEA